MQKFKLKNGLTVIYLEKPSQSVAVEVLVDVGSNNESLEEAGISHFIEHMVFEGTRKRGSSREIANEIEKIGGELNAYTSNERTCYFARVLNKHFDKALDVISDILQNPLFREEDIEKQRKIILKEVGLVTDEPRFFQWILFGKSLFKKHPAKNPTYGTVKTVKSMTKKQILDYYKKYYQPNNMVISVVGKVKGLRKRLENKFVLDKGKLTKFKSVKEPKQNKIRVLKERRKITNTYVVLGYRTVPRKEKESYALDVIDAILGRGQSGWMFDTIRSQHGLAYEVGTQHVAEKDYGFFGIHLSVDKEKINLVKKLIFEVLERLKKVSDEDLKEAKEFIEGDYLLENEETQKAGDNIVNWEQLTRAEDFFNYVKTIKKVKKNDIKRAVEKYFTKNYCLVIIEGK
ncbi:M16 family metallopeptidase [Nanoarchaeota archaeon]